MSLTVLSMGIVGLLIFAALVTLLVTFVGYRRYKQPLLEVDSTLKYSFTHYLHLVVLPRLAYRIRAKLPSKGRS